jgi:hypothetical protein
MIFEDAQDALNGASPTPTGTDSTAATPPTSSTTDNNNSGNEADPKKAAMEKGEAKAEEIKQITTQFEHLNTFTLWFISIENDKKKKEQIENQIKNLSASLEKLEKEKQAAETPAEVTQSPDVIKDSFNPFRKK